MNYEPLHHKYRPQTFAQLVGQEAIAQTLSNALNRNKIAPAYLFTGPRGTGKTSSARILAKSLNCIQTQGPTATPCGECEICVSITKGSSWDVMELDAASHTGVDNIREIIERSQFAPVQCRYKVYVIDECHMLSTAAFNSLLKTLEEPPDRVVFVLATTDPQRVLPTIISRCQRFDFRRIPLESMVHHLKDIANKEAIAITEEAIILVAQISQGGLRDAESLLDQLSLLVGADDVTEVGAEQVWDLVGSVPERDLLQLLEAISKPNPADILDLTKNILDRGREPLTLLHNLTSFYRDLLIAKTAPQRQDLVALTASTWKHLIELSQHFSLPQILAAQTHLQESETQLKNTTQPRLWLEVSLLGLLSANQPPVQASPAPVVNTPAASILPAPKPAISPGTKPVARPQPNPQPSPAQDTQPTEPVTPVKTDNLEQLWQTVIDNLELPGTKVLISKHCSLLSLNDKTAQIGINRKGAQNLVKGVQPQLQEAFKKTFHHPFSLKFQLLDDTEKKIPLNPLPPAQKPEIVQESVARRSPTPPPQPSLDQEKQREKQKVRQAAEGFADFFDGEIMNLKAKIDLPKPESIKDESSYLESMDDDEDPPF
ncbi:DNA polymerase III subunit gamma/tau [Roseofilum reptotaenium CS-1145]|uniref:DNA polymerase III subunit gamma/tau n=1 Tax=Roseofilum reptotaenium AO1-A TaxID=1925591 RepID=A0A1L9QV89_9CYAN|nr:DNA polymerase III subunit gamma/tau [Roseofilum reptotaenium]MDB9518801.1 DNA polymerase III subunit gamma/tau [Roseofilum reptotaenium CS-1145]OJJ26588.1 DNA polymerase III, subunit gamma and tau [Roseofilum reptotaenium AO1-A]